MFVVICATTCADFAGGVSTSTTYRQDKSLGAPMSIYRIAALPLLFHQLKLLIMAKKKKFKNYGKRIFKKLAKKFAQIHKASSNSI